MDIDLIINQAVSGAALLSGVPAGLLLKRGLSVETVVIAPAPWNPFASRWLPNEELFLRAQIGKMTDAEIGAALGRTEAAIKIRRVRKGMPSPSKRPGWVTGHGAANRLGVDIHLIMRLVREGIMPAEILPGERGIISIRLDWLHRWAVNPQHWIYFKFENIKDTKLKRLLKLKQARWRDEWWTTGQVAAWHGVHHTDVERFIMAGKLPAVKWNNWRVLRSDATRPGLYFPKGKGAGVDLVDWSEEGDAFMLLARAVGCTHAGIQRITGRANFSYRLFRLWEWGQVEYLVEKYDLAVQVDAKHRLVLADWFDYADRFPGLVRALARFHRFLCGEQLFARKHPPGFNDLDLCIVRGVLHTWAAWYARTDEQKEFARRLAHANHARAETLRAALEEIRSWGADPFGGPYEQ